MGPILEEPGVQALEPLDLDKLRGLQAWLGWLQTGEGPLTPR